MSRHFIPNLCRLSDSVILNSWRIIMNHKKFFPLWLACSVIFLSCSPSSNNTQKPQPVKHKKPFNVILITDVGGRGDKGFNDAGWAGCEDAKRRLAEGGAEIGINAIESREQTDYVDNLNLAAERADVVVALGFLIAESVQQTAPRHPKKSFIFIDGRIEGKNIASFDFKSQEGAYLAGILAGYVSQTGIVSVLPGMDIPPVEAFASGYRAGVLTCGALRGMELKALSATIGSFNDPVKGKSLAQSLLGQKADILFQLAGNSGWGVIEAVRDTPERSFVIGVDINQDDLAPGKVLTSVLKRMDQVVSDQIQAVYNDSFHGGIFEVGLKDGYVGLTQMVHTRQFVPPEAISTLEKARTMIVNGTLKVPGTYQALKDFQPPVVLFRNQ